MLLIDKYAYSNKLTGKSINIKVSISLVCLLIAITSNNVYVSTAIIALMSILILFVAGIRLADYINLLKVPMFFLVMGTIATVISISTNNDGFIYSFNLYNLYIGLSQNSISEAFHLALKSISCITCVYFFMVTTPFNEIIILLKRLKTPETVIEIIVLMYRFIFIFLEEVSEIKKSQELKFGYINIVKSYRSTGLLMNVLFNRLIIRYNEMHIALDMKLYDGKFYVVEDDNV